MGGSHRLCTKSFHVFGYDPTIHLPLSFQALITKHINHLELNLLDLKKINNLDFKVDCYVSEVCLQSLAKMVRHLSKCCGGLPCCWQMRILTIYIYMYDYMNMYDI